MSKKLIEKLLKNSKDIEVKKLKGNIENQIPGTKWKIQLEGEFKDMSKKMSIEELAKIVIEGFDKINSRLDVLESFHKEDLDKLKSQKKK